jgi:hypothetical protein
VKLTDTSSDWDLLLAWMRGIGEPSDRAAPEGEEVQLQPDGGVPGSGRSRVSEPSPERSEARREALR